MDTDPHQISIYCPFCNTHTSLRMAMVETGANRTVPMIYRHRFEGRWWMGICNKCERPVLVLEDGHRVFPTPLTPEPDKRIPKDVRRDLYEAHLCFTASAFRASAVMARRAIEASCVAHQATAGNLMAKIDKLRGDGHITAKMAEWAHAIRWVGNDAVHIGGEEVTKSDAEQVIKLAEHLLQVLYVTGDLANQQIARHKPSGAP